MAQIINSGVVLSDAKAKSAGCLRLQLRLPGGKTILTTVTHTYIWNPSLLAVLKLVADWIF